MKNQKAMVDPKACHCIVKDSSIARKYINMTVYEVNFPGNYAARTVKATWPLDECLIITASEVCSNSQEMLYLSCLIA